MISSIKREKWFRIALGLLMIVMIAGTLWVRLDTRYATRVIVESYGNMEIYPPTINMTQDLGFELWNEANHSISIPEGCLAYLQINQSEIKNTGDQQCIRSDGGEIAPGITTLPYNGSFRFWKVYDHGFDSYLLYNVSASISDGLQSQFGSIIDYTFNLTIARTTGTYASWVNFEIQQPQDYGMVTNSSNHPLHLRLRPQWLYANFFPYRITQHLMITAQLLNRGRSQKIDDLDCTRPYLDIEYDGVTEVSYKAQPVCSTTSVAHTIKEGLTEYKIPVDLVFYHYDTWQLPDLNGTLTMHFVNPLITDNHSFAAYIHYEHGKISNISYDKNYYIWH